MSAMYHSEFKFYTIPYFHCQGCQFVTFFVYMFISMITTFLFLTQSEWQICLKNPLIQAKVLRLLSFKSYFLCLGYKFVFLFFRPCVSMWTTFSFLAQSECKIYLKNPLIQAKVFRLLSFKSGHWLWGKKSKLKFYTTPYFLCQGNRNRWQGVPICLFLCLSVC